MREFQNLYQLGYSNQEIYELAAAKAEAELEGSVVGSIQFPVGSTKQYYTMGSTDMTEQALLDLAAQR